MLLFSCTFIPLPKNFGGRCKGLCRRSKVHRFVANFKLANLLYRYGIVPFVGSVFKDMVRYRIKVLNRFSFFKSSLGYCAMVNVRVSPLLSGWSCRDIFSSFLHNRSWDLLPPSKCTNWQFSKDQQWLNRRSLLKVTYLI